VLSCTCIYRWICRGPRLDRLSPPPTLHAESDEDFCTDEEISSLSEERLLPRCYSTFWDKLMANVSIRQRPEMKFCKVLV